MHIIGQYGPGHNMELDYQIGSGEVFRHEWGVYSGVNQSCEGDGVIVKVRWIVATFHVFPAVCPDEICHDWYSNLHSYCCGV